MYEQNGSERVCVTSCQQGETAQNFKCGVYKNNLSVGAWVGIGVGIAAGAAGIVAAILAGVFCCRKKKAIDGLGGAEHKLNYTADVEMPKMYL